MDPVKEQEETLSTQKEQEETPLGVDQAILSDEPAPQLEKTADKGQAAPAGEQVAKSWKDFGLDEFEGKSAEDVAKAVSQLRREKDYQNQLYGRLTNELGELRKFKDETEKTLKAQPKKEPAETVMTPAQLQVFNEEYEKNPAKALLKYFGDDFKAVIREELKTAMGETSVEDMVGETAERLEISQLQHNHPEDADNLIGTLEEPGPIMILDQKENLGTQRRPLEELYQLAKMGLANDQLYSPVYGLMKKYPQMPVAEAKNIAQLQLTRPDAAAQKIEQAKATAAKLDTVSTHAKSAPKSDTSGEVMSIDQAFEVNT